MPASIKRGEESVKIPRSAPLPADPTGQRLCEIFGHYPWNFIRADLPDDATAKVEWTTITAYPLRPRVLWNHWQDANQLIGVRFTHYTHYALLDLDAGGDYCTAAGVAQLRAALETLGLTRTLLIRSSWGGGLHLYIPLAERVNTFNLAVTLKECLKAQGFRLQAGQLEIFPNVKAYGVQTFIDYAAHRLPLQPGSGSCLLDEALNPIGDSLARFFWLWDGAAAHQDLDTLRHAMKIGRDNHRKRPKLRSHPVESWRHDLDVEITEGWTAPGQTNHLLKTIACYGHVFEGHQGQDLIAYTLRIALNCPGYEQYCRHQHEIERKVTAWARAVEGYYWPLGTPPSRDTSQPKNNLVPFNQQQAEDAQHRICTAYAELEQAGELPEQITARAKAIAQLAKVSQQTLYKHLSLWHPAHQEGVIAQLASLLAPEEAISEVMPESLEPFEIKELHPSEKYMKSEALCASDLGSDPNSFPPERGVRGDESSFPQADEPADYDPDLNEQLQRQIRSLGWTWTVFCQFMADQFEGKRWSNLTEEDRLLLLYRLRVLDSLDVGELAVVTTQESSSTHPWYGLSRDGSP
jgi:pimeloyl-ACP methyl ester carboxylesterase